MNKPVLVDIRFLPYLSRSRGRIFIVSLYSLSLIHI